MAELKKSSFITCISSFSPCRVMFLCLTNYPSYHPPLHPYRPDIPISILPPTQLPSCFKLASSTNQQVVSSLHVLNFVKQEIRSSNFQSENIKVICESILMVILITTISPKRCSMTCSTFLHNDEKLDLKWMERPDFNGCVINGYVTDNK